MTRDKLMTPYLATHNRFALDTSQRFLGLTGTTILYDAGQPEDLRYIMGLLNSKLLTRRFQSIGKLKSGGILEYFWNSISKLPIRRIDFSDTADRARHDQIVVVVDQLLALHRRTSQSVTVLEQNVLRHQMAAADRKLDRLVSDLYCLTEQEVALVEAEEARSSNDIGG